MKKFLPSPGFTLVELLVVISIIAILSVIGLTIYTSVQKNARDAKRIGDLDAIKKGLEQYFVTNKAYPSEGQFATQIGTYFGGGSVPKDPQSPSRDYNYWSRGTCATTKYVICTQLEDCGSKCTLNGTLSLSTDSCSAGTPGSGNTHYCIMSQL